MASHTTTDHDEIRRRTEKHDGTPARVRGTANDEDDPGLLRIAFTDDGELEAIGWDEWFDKFDCANLAFLYQDGQSGGSENRFFKLVNR